MGPYLTCSYTTRWDSTFPSVGGPRSAKLLTASGGTRTSERGRPRPVDLANASQLFPNEEIVTVDRQGILVYLREGDPGRPLLVFLSGGYHLGRIAYGHPDARPSDFLDYWLNASGLGLLAISQPTDHPITGPASPLSCPAAWSKAAAQIVLGTLGSNPAIPPIIACWSSGGLIAARLALDLAELGISIANLISLAATPALPNIAPQDPSIVALTPSGFVDLTRRRVQGPPSALFGFEKQLLAQSELNGRHVITIDQYRRHYVANAPPQFVGDLYTDGSQIFADGWRMGRELNGLDYSAYPLAGIIVPTSASDARHALSDIATWTFLNVQSVLARYRYRDDAWSQYLEIVQSVSARLARRVEGNHFFFVGEKGARASSEAITELTSEIAKIDLRLRSLADGAPHS